MEGYRAQTKKARLDAFDKMDDFRALAATGDDNENDHEKTLITLINHHRKRAFTEANIGSDPEGIISNPWRPAEA